LVEILILISYTYTHLYSTLYSPQIKKKITLPEWQNVNRDINEGKLPHRYQEEIYNRIAATPLKLTGEHGEEKVELVSSTCPPPPNAFSAGAKSPASDLGTCGPYRAPGPSPKGVDMDLREQADGQAGAGTSTRASCIV
jgi:hypothetical protein